MNPVSRIRFLPLSTIGLAAAVAFLAGCESVESALQRDTPREDLTGTLDEVAAEVAEVNGRMDETVRQLNEIYDHPAADLQRQFNGYRESLNQLEASHDRLMNLTDELQRKGREYLIEWDREIATIRTDDLRNNAMERKNDVSDRLDALYNRYAEARNSITPFIRRLNEVESALSVDLTAAGVQNVSRTGDNLDSVTNPARDGLNNLSDALREAAQALAARGRAVVNP